MMEQSNELLDGCNNLSLNSAINTTNGGDINQETAVVLEGVPGKTIQAVMGDENALGETFEDEEDESDEEETGDSSMARSISNASMWTRKDIDTFKETIRAEGGDGVLKVGHGEIATIRVPTHENGNCIFWEFATDSYDIGFGLLFEWNASPDNQVSIHISESEDEDDEEGSCGRRVPSLLTRFLSFPFRGT